WLLGELYNARGDIKAAADIFKDIDNRVNADPRDTDFLAASASTVGLMGTPLGQGPILAAAALNPGRINELPRVGFQKKQDRMPKLLRQHNDLLPGALKKHQEPPQHLADTSPPPPTTPGATPTADGSPAKPFPIDLRALGVGFLTGLLVALLAVWQIR